MDCWKWSVDSFLVGQLALNVYSPLHQWNFSHLSFALPLEIEHLTMAIPIQFHTHIPIAQVWPSHSRICTVILLGPFYFLLPFGLYGLLVIQKKSQNESQSINTLQHYIVHYATEYFHWVHIGHATSKHIILCLFGGFRRIPILLNQILMVVLEEIHV